MFNKLNRYSKTSLKLLSFIAANPLKKMYVREISKSLEISVGSVSQILRGFAKENLVTVEKRGNMLFYSVNLENPEVREFKVWLNISEINPLVEKIKVYSDLIYLYGSTAEGTDTSKSDFDLLVVTEDKHKTRTDIRKFRTRREIKAVVVNNKEFRDLKKNDEAFYEQVRKGKELWRREIELSV